MAYKSSPSEVNDQAPNGVFSFLELPRVFYPFTLCIPRAPTPQALCTFNPISGITSPLFALPDEPTVRPFVDLQTLVAVCCAVKNIALGIYFGPDSIHNFSLLVHDVPPHNASHLATEIFAVHKTLKIARQVANVFGADRVAIMRVIVVMESTTVYKFLTQWVGEVEKTEWKGADELFEGAEVNRPALERLERAVVEMIDEDGIEVVFWLVGADGVADAERLAVDRIRRGV